VLFLILGFVLILNSSIRNITGNIIEGGINFGDSLLGLAFISVGLVFFLTKESELEKKVKEDNLAQQVLKIGKIYSKQREFKRIANRMNYSGREFKEGYQILDYNGNPLTVIPKHKISKGVHYSILKALATGESSFRKAG